MNDLEKEKRRKRVKTKLDNLGRALVGVGLSTLGSSIHQRDPKKGAEIALQVGKAVQIFRGNSMTEKHLDEMHQMVASKNPKILKAGEVIEEEMTAAYFSSISQADSELTKRHAADMLGDSWLAKNVRPASAWALIATQIILTAWMVVNLPDVSGNALTIYLTQTSLAYGVCRFYFGSRKEEKLENLKNYYSHFIGRP